MKRSNRLQSLKSVCHTSKNRPRLLKGLFCVVDAVGAEPSKLLTNQSNFICVTLDLFSGAKKKTHFNVDLAHVSEWAFSNAAYTPHSFPGGEIRWMLRPSMTSHLRMCCCNWGVIGPTVSQIPPHLPKACKWKNCRMRVHVP